MTPPHPTHRSLEALRSTRPFGLAAAMLLATVWASSACGDSSGGPSGRVTPPGPPVCSAGPARPALDLEPNLAELAPGGRAPKRVGTSLFVVQSLSNTVGRYDLESGAYERTFIDLGEGRNPFGIAFSPSGDRAWITNLARDTVSIADRSSGEVLAELENDSFDRPSAIAVGDRRAYVASTQLRGEGSFGAGRLTLVDRSDRSRTESVETEWKNPQHVRRIRTERGTRIAVVDTGVLTQSGEVRSPAGLELWEPAGNLDPEHRRTYELGFDPEDGVGAPGRPLPAPGGRYLYFTSATAPVLFKFDLERREWVRGVSDPIPLYETDALSLDRGAMGPDGILLVAAFNRDALYGFDTTCDERLFGPVDLGVAPERPEGPAGIAPVRRSSRTDVFYTMGLSNRLGRARLDDRTRSLERNELGRDR